jgi:hypothetical protein
MSTRGFDRRGRGLHAKFLTKISENIIVGVSPCGIPPPLSDALSWRVLWRAAAFTQLDLVGGTSFSGTAKDRGLRLGIGQQPLETLDVQGSLQPIAFAAGDTRTASSISRRSRLA